MKEVKCYVLFLIYMITTVSLMAEEKESTKSVFNDDILFTEVNPLHPFGIFTLDLPLYFGTFTQRGSKFSIAYSFGNTWHPAASIQYPYNITEQQRQEINERSAFGRKNYFLQNQVPFEEKTFSSDGVIQNLSFTWLWQLEKNGSFIFKLNTNFLSSGTSFVHYLASDNVIEKTHDLFGVHDNFGRHQYYFDRAHIEFIDENNRELRIDDGDAFMSTFDVHYYKPLWRIQKNKTYHSFQFGSHLAIPFNKYYTKVGGGISGAFFLKQIFTSKFNIGFGCDFGLIVPSLFSFGESVNIIDNKFRKSAKLYIAPGFPLKKENNAISFGLVANYQDPLLDGYIFSRSQDMYQDLGITVLRKGDVWEGYEVEEVYHHAKLTPASMYFFSIKLYVFVEYKFGKSKFAINLGEDMQALNNAPDVQYGFRYTIDIGK